MTVYADKYIAHKLYLINASKDTIDLALQDGQIKIIQQAKNKNGKWQDIENFINSWCSHSYYMVKLAPHEYQIYPVPIFKGTFKTRLRFKVKLNKKEIYSNEFVGEINKGQFLNPKDKDKKGVILWTF